MKSYFFDEGILEIEALLLSCQLNDCTITSPIWRMGVDVGGLLREEVNKLKLFCPGQVMATQILPQRPANR